MGRALYSWVRSMVDTLLLAGLISSLISASLAGVSSTLITYTRTQFLAIESLHMVIAAGLVGSLVGWYIKALPGDMLSTLAMAMLTLLVAYMIDKGYSQDASIGFGVVTASMVASASSYYLALGVPGGVSYIYSLLFGNPFLLPLGQAPIYIAYGLTILAVIATMWRHFIYMAFDPEFFELVKGRSRLYRWILYTLVAITAVYISRLVGAIPAHILLLVPGMVVQSIGGTSYVQGIMIAIAFSIPASMISYTSGLPYGLTLGILSIIVYIAARVRGRGI